MSKPERRTFLQTLTKLLTSIQLFKNCLEVEFFMTTLSFKISISCTETEAHKYEFISSKNNAQKNATVQSNLCKRKT